MSKDDERDAAVEDARYATAGRLVRGAVHDIKNPVGFVSGNLTYLRQSGGQIAERIEALRQHLGPYAAPGELREAVVRLLEVVDREGPELEACLDECDQGLEQLVGHSRALARAAQISPTPESFELVDAVREGVESARLFGRHIASVEVEVPAREVRQSRRGLATLVTALVVDVLEGCGRRATGYVVRVRYQDGLVIEDDAPYRDLPQVAGTLAAGLGLELSRVQTEAGNLTRVCGL